MTGTYSLAALWSDWRDDINSYLEEGLGASVRPGLRGRLQAASAALIPSVVCCFSYRVSHWLFCHRMRRLAGGLATFNHAVFGASISPGSEIGGGLYIPHPTGVVIQAKAGRHLRVYAAGGVYCFPWRPLGGEPLIGAPTLGANVRIGAQAAVAGPINIGDGATVSFSAVVREDVPAQGTSMQSPLRNYRVGKSERTVAA